MPPTIGVGSPATGALWSGPLPDRPPFVPFCFVCAARSPGAAEDRLEAIQGLPREHLSLPSGRLTVVANESPFVPGGQLVIPERHAAILDAGFGCLLLEAMDELPVPPTFYASNGGSVPQHAHAHWLGYRFRSLLFLDELERASKLSCLVASADQHRARPLVLVLPKDGHRRVAAEVLFNPVHGFFALLDESVGSADLETRHELDDPTWVIVFRPGAIAVFLVSQLHVHPRGGRRSLKMPGHVLVLESYREDDQLLLEAIGHRPWQWSLTAKPKFRELLRNRLAAAIQAVTGQTEDPGNVMACL